MLRRFVASAAVMFIITGFVLAGEYTGLITKIDKSEVTFKSYKKKGDKGEEKTIKHKKAKITKGEDEVKMDDFTKMVDDAASGSSKRKGVFAKITTEGEGDNEVITKIAVIKPKRDKKKKDE